MNEKDKPEKNWLPVSVIQRELWSASQLGENTNRAYIRLVWLHLKGALDKQALGKAVKIVARRHDALRMVFSDDGSCCRVLPESAIALEHFDVSLIGKTERCVEMRRLEQEAVKALCDLEQGPLFLARLARWGEQDNSLLAGAHSLVCDDWSMRVVLEDLATAYNALLEGKEPFHQQVFSFCELLTRGDEEKRLRSSGPSLEYWKARLKPLPEPLDVPTWKIRPRRQTFASARYSHFLENSFAEEVRAFAARQELSLEELFSGVLAIYLYRTCRQDDLVIGMAVSGRDGSELGKIVGPMATLLPLRFHLSPEISFLEFLQQCRKNCVDARSHQHLAFSDLSQVCQLPREAGRLSLFSVVLYEDPRCAPLSLTNLSASIEIPERSWEYFELVFGIVRKGDQLVLQCQYNSDIHDASMMALHCQGLQEILASGMKNPSDTLNSLPLVSGEERYLQLEHFNKTQRTLPPVKSFLPLFQEVAHRYADKAAVIFRKTVLRYCDLHDLSDQLAARLIELGIGAGTLVGVHLHRSHKMYIAILGILKSGAGYVPLDPAFPYDRLQYMIDDAGVTTLVTEKGLPETPFSGIEHRIDLDVFGNETVPVNTSLLQQCSPEQDHVGYVIYTSGSTGRPKGVVVPHRGILNLLVSMQHTPGMEENDRLLAVTTLSFDMAVPELYLPLITGATIVVAGKEDVTDGGRLVDLLQEHEITMFQATPSTWRMLLAAGWQGSEKLKGLIGGEALPRSLAHELVPRLGELWNMYGPTETTVWSTAWRVPQDVQQILVGRPIDNTQLYVLDEHGQLVPRGVPGELFIGGFGVTKGYLNRDELNTRSFVQNPFSETPDVIYRTGDLVRYDLDGNLEYISRLDHQVKLRGYRIELGEIETAITRATGIKEVVVSIYSLSEEDQRLVAYIRSGGVLDQDALRSDLQAVLPPYMVPQHFIVLDRFPLTVNGKIDRKALPAPYLETRDSSRHVEPRNDFERSLVAVWKQVLKTDQVGITDNFFDMGGHSLLALTLINEMKKATNVDIAYGALFAMPTIKELVDNLDASTSNQASIIVPLQPEGDQLPLFCLCGIDLYREMALSLGRDQPVYAIYVDEEQGLLEEAANGKVAEVSVRQLAQAYHDAIVRQQQHGPYQLAGISFGGIVAIETARLLQEHGEKVRLVALLDTILPEGKRQKKLGTIKHHLKNFKREGFGYLVSRSKEKVRKAMYSQPWMNRKKDEKEVSTAYYRELAYVEAMETYQGDVEPFDGDVLLLKARDKWGENSVMVYEEDYGWQRHIRGRLDIYEVPGDHLGIIRKPHVQELADILTRFLKKT